MHCRFMCFFAVAVIVSSPFVAAQSQLDLKDPTVRKMILEERKHLDCEGIYQQTRLKVDAQIKLLNKVEASGGVSPQTIASLTEATTALGQKRREFCSLYKVTPEMNKEDYFRNYGEIDKGESDIALVLRVATGQAPQSELKKLQTVKAQETSSGTPDIPKTLNEIVSTVDSVTARVGKAEQRISALETQQAPTRLLTAEQERIFVNDLASVPSAPFWYITETVFHSLTSDEQGFFSSQMAEILGKAKWRDLRPECAAAADPVFVKQNCIAPIYQDPSDRGVVIVSPESLLPSAQGLSREMNKFGIRNLVLVSKYAQPGVELKFIVLRIGVQ